jgi:hypothetical protein
MKFKFRKSKKLLPGLKVNVTNKGISANIGGKRTNLGVGKRGTFLNTSIPKTGISGRQKMGSGCSTIIASVLVLAISIIVAVLML